LNIENSTLTHLSANCVPEGETGRGQDIARGGGAVQAPVPAIFFTRGVGGFKIG